MIDDNIDCDSSLNVADIMRYRERMIRQEERQHDWIDELVRRECGHHDARRYLMMAMPRERIDDERIFRWEFDYALQRLARSGGPIEPRLCRAGRQIYQAVQGLIPPAQRIVRQDAVPDWSPQPDPRRIRLFGMDVVVDPRLGPNEFQLIGVERPRTATEVTGAWRRARERIGLFGDVRLRFGGRNDLIDDLRSFRNHQAHVVERMPFVLDASSWMMHDFHGRSSRPSMFPDADPFERPPARKKVTTQAFLANLKRNATERLYTPPDAVARAHGAAKLLGSFVVTQLPKGARIKPGFEDKARLLLAMGCHPLGKEPEVANTFVSFTRNRGEPPLTVAWMSGWAPVEADSYAEAARLVAGPMADVMDESVQWAAIDVFTKAESTGCSIERAFDEVLSDYARGAAPRDGAGAQAQAQTDRRPNAAAPTVRRAFEDAARRIVPQSRDGQRTL